MLTCFLKRVLPFLLTLIFGVAAGSIFSPATPAPTNYRSVLVATNHKACPHRYQSYSSSPLVINSMPVVRFPSMRQAEGFRATIRVYALLGSDGRVWDVKADPQLPYGEALSPQKSVKSALRSEPNKDLNSLAQILMDDAKQIQFTPAISNGEATSTWVSIDAEFGDVLGDDCIGCSATSVIVKEGDVVRWWSKTTGDGGSASGRGLD